MIIKAKKNPPKPVTPPPPTIELNLVLSLKEATALMSLCGNIGGNPNGPREITSEIFYELQGAGINTGGYLVIKGGSVILVDDYPVV